jgi:hypothetical protein
MILDKQRKLLIYLGEDGQNKEFHVEDFVGLYPAWPIVEVAISPTGNAKEERMNMFVKCITARDTVRRRERMHCPIGDHGR